MEPGLDLLLAAPAAASAIQQNRVCVFACNDGQWALMGQAICEAPDFQKEFTGRP